MGCLCQRTRVGRCTWWLAVKLSNATGARVKGGRDGWLACQPIKTQQGEEEEDEERRARGVFAECDTLLVQCRLGRVRSGQGRVERGLCSGFSLGWGVSLWWFGRVVYMAVRASV